MTTHDTFRLKRDVPVTVAVRYLDQIKGYRDGDPMQLRVRGDTGGKPVQIFLELDVGPKLLKAGVISAKPVITDGPGPWKCMVPANTVIDLVLLETGVDVGRGTAAASEGWPATTPAPAGNGTESPSATGPVDDAEAMRRARLGWALLREVSIAAMRIAVQAFTDGFGCAKTDLDQAAVQDFASTIMIRAEHTGTPVAVGLTKTEGWPPPPDAEEPAREREPGED